MRCRLVTLASLLSLVLCLAATLVWAIDIEAVGGAGRDPRVVIELLHGRITVALTSPRTPAADVHDLRTLAARGRTYRLAGFEYDGGEESGYVNLLEIGTSSFVHEYHAVHRVGRAVLGSDRGQRGSGSSSHPLLASGGPCGSAFGHGCVRLLRV